MNLNKVMIIGRLGKDPEVKQTPSGSTICKFTVATTEYSTDKTGKKSESTAWHNIVTFGKTAENCGKFLAKGRACYVEGRINYNSWEKDGKKYNSTNIVAQTVQFLDKGEAKSTSPIAPAPAQQQQDFTVDDLPF